jgi:hypothetical protein
MKIKIRLRKAGVAGVLLFVIMDLFLPRTEFD